MLTLLSVMTEGAMASLTIRNLEEALKSRLRVQAATHGRSMEEEARALLRAALSLEGHGASGLGSAVNALFRPVGGLDIFIPPREPIREPPILT
jgi:plasmid stability protein